MSAQGFVHKPITIYFISGVWFESGRPSHYAVHQFLDPGVSGAKKMPREFAVDLVDRPGITVYIWKWDYALRRFDVGEQVKTVGYSLNTVPTNDNHIDLKHLINYDWLPK